MNFITATDLADIELYALCREAQALARAIRLAAQRDEHNLARTLVIEWQKVDQQIKEKCPQ